MFFARIAFGRLLRIILHSNHYYDDYDDNFTILNEKRRLFFGYFFFEKRKKNQIKFDTFFFSFKVNLNESYDDDLANTEFCQKTKKKNSDFFP